MNPWKKLILVTAAFAGVALGGVRGPGLARADGCGTDWPDCQSTMGGCGRDCTTCIPWYADEDPNFVPLPPDPAEEEAHCQDMCADYGGLWWHSSFMHWEGNSSWLSVTCHCNLTCPWYVD